MSTHSGPARRSTPLAFSTVLVLVLGAGLLAPAALAQRTTRPPERLLGVPAPSVAGDTAATPAPAATDARPDTAPGVLGEAVSPPLGSTASRRGARTIPIAARHEMVSTAYCLKGNTRTGIRTRDGVAAADPRFLPLGSVIRVSHPDERILGIFVIMDTGGAVKGRKLDIYMDSCSEARRWGVKRVVAEVVDLGRNFR